MRRTALAVVAVIVLAGSPALGHHGYANFFMDRTVTIQGEIEEVRWANPHVVLRIRAADSTVYTALFHQGASYFVNREVPFERGLAAADDPRNKHTPLTRQSIKVGDHVVVTAAPPRDPASHEVVSIREVRRPRDGWTWKRTNEANQAAARAN